MKAKPIPPLMWYIVAAPFVYLAIIYGDLPEQIPIHYNLKGEVDGWGHKRTLWVLPIVGPLLTMVILTRMVPLLDFENKIEKMGKNFNRMNLAIVGAMSALMLYFIHQAGKEDLGDLNALLIIFGILYTFLGNYLFSVRQNRLVGIRTPWTLRSESVWRKTNRLAGRLWFWGGMVIALLGFFLPKTWAIPFFLGATILLCLIPAYYSYRCAKVEDASGML